MSQDFEARIDAALAGLPPDLREVAGRNVGELRRSIEIRQQQLARVLEDESSSAQLRSTAAWIVGILGESSLSSVLSRVVLTANQPLVLWEATKALCALGEGGDLFRTMLETGSSAEHRQAAAYALGRIRDTSSTRLLVQILASEAESPGLRAQTAEALGYMGDREAFPALVAAAADPSAEVRFWSVFALGNLGDRRAVPVLERLAREDHDVLEGWWAVSQEAASALEEIRKSSDSD
jgi:HEAT repeat protein